MIVCVGSVIPAVAGIVVCSPSIYETFTLMSSREMGDLQIEILLPFPEIHYCVIIRNIQKQILIFHIELGKRISPKLFELIVYFGISNSIKPPQTSVHVSSKVTYYAIQMYITYRYHTSRTPMVWPGINDLDMSYFHWQCSGHFGNSILLYTYHTRYLHPEVDCIAWHIQI